MAGLNLNSPKLEIQISILNRMDMEIEVYLYTMERYVFMKMNELQIQVNTVLD